MGERLIRQANGLFAVYSDTVDDLVLYDSDAEGIINLYAEEAACRAREAARLWVEGKAPGRRIYTIEQAMEWFDVLHDPDLSEDHRSEAKAVAEKTRAILENPSRPLPDDTNMIVAKYHIPQTTYSDVIMRKGAKLLHVAAQGDDLCLWALVELNAPSVKRRFRVATTGDRVTTLVASWPYVGTGHLSGGSFVLHVFDGGEVEE